MIDGKKGSFSRFEEKAGLPGHGPVLAGIKLTANDGVYPVGLLLTRTATDQGEPLLAVSGEVLATGNGSTKAFSAALDAVLPVEPGSVAVTDGVEDFTDDGCGRLVGSAGGTGTVNYQTGEVSVSFNANVGNGVSVTTDYITAVDAVLDETVDTSVDTSGNAVIHGTVAKDALKVGVVAKASPSAALLRALRNKGIYPV